MKTRNLLLALTCAAAVSVNAEHKHVPLDLFTATDDLEVTLWATSPMFYNPTNIDIDKDGRIWVAEGVNYRRHGNRKPEGDRIVVLEDKDGDGKADSSHVFVQEKFLTAPLGVAVIDNKIVVSMTPDMIVYTDVNRDLKFDPSVDKREVLLTGFKNKQHDHTLHSVTVGPDGSWYWNHGNCGAVFTDKSGKTFRLGSAYDNRQVAGHKSDDGNVWIGGAAYRMNPDGTNVQVIGHNFRNSYEQTVTSFGDVFQNDNDDPPACRTTFLLEYGNAGFCSEDGKRGWGADKRPGQSTQIAEWRQEDPGTMPAGDVYGGGSPTGIAYYENGALGEKHRGMLLSCEPARNVVFGYYPKAEGAGYKLERFDFLTTNKEKEFAGADFKGGRPNNETKTLFRPSDVAIGPDGAVYVSDWYDARVGGHQDLDNTLSGSIYRVAPKGFKPSIPKFDLATTEGQITALKSHAVNVRHLGREKLKAQGAKAVPAVAKLLDDPDKYIQARAIWMLSLMGPEGLAKVVPLMKSDDAMTRVAAFRAVRRQDHKTLAFAKHLASDPSPAVRREVALAMRNISGDEAVAILAEIAKGYDGKDRTYLEALGTGAHGKEEAVYNAAGKALGEDADPSKWTDKFATIAWRLHPAKSAEHLAKRAKNNKLTPEARKAAVVALAFIPNKNAADAMLNVAVASGSEIGANALWWLMNRKDTSWKEHGILDEMKKQGLYNENQKLISVVTPEPVQNTLKTSEILALKGDPEKGKIASARCIMCHKIGDVGVDFGPDLNGFGKTQTSEVLVNSIIDPSADISHGYEGWAIETKDGTEIHGIVLAKNNPTIMRSMGGQTQTIPRGQLKRVRKMNRSLMMSASTLQMKAQEVADVVAYLKSL